MNIRIDSAIGAMASLAGLHHSQSTTPSRRIEGGGGDALGRPHDGAFSTRGDRVASNGMPIQVDVLHEERGLRIERVRDLSPLFEPNGAATTGTDEVVIDASGSSPANVAVNPGPEGSVIVTVNGESTQVVLAPGQTLRVVTGDGDDLVYIDPSITTGVVVQTGAGNDFIQGGSGNDTILSGDGQDTVFAGAGDDYVELGAGVGDVLYGEDGNDTLIGGSGSDDSATIHGGDGDDRIVAPGGFSDVSGGTGSDTLTNLALGDRYMLDAYDTAYDVNGRQVGIGDDPLPPAPPTTSASANTFDATLARTPPAPVPPGVTDA